MGGKCAFLANQIFSLVGDTRLVCCFSHSSVVQYGVPGVCRHDTLFFQSCCVLNVVCPPKMC
jgi:hypothetical protein